MAVANNSVLSTLAMSSPVEPVRYLLGVLNCAWQTRMIAKTRLPISNKEIIPFKRCAGTDLDDLWSRLECTSWSNGWHSSAP